MSFKYYSELFNREFESADYNLEGLSKIPYNKDEFLNAIKALQSSQYLIGDKRKDIIVDNTVNWEVLSVLQDKYRNDEQFTRLEGLIANVAIIYMGNLPVKSSLTQALDELVEGIGLDERPDISTFSDSEMRPSEELKPFTLLRDQKMDSYLHVLQMGTRTGFRALTQLSGREAPPTVSSPQGRVGSLETFFYNFLKDITQNDLEILSKLDDHTKSLLTLRKSGHLPIAPTGPYRGLVSKSQVQLLTDTMRKSFRSKTLAFQTIRRFKNFIDWAQIVTGGEFTDSQLTLDNFNARSTWNDLGFKVYSLFADHSSGIISPKGKQILSSNVLFEYLKFTPNGAFHSITAGENFGSYKAMFSRLVVINLLQESDVQ